MNNHNLFYEMYTHVYSQSTILSQFYQQLLSETNKSDKTKSKQTKKQK